MRYLTSVLLILFTSHAAADHLDIIQAQLRGNCTLGDYLEIVEDFNEWGKDYDYRAEIAVPLQSHDLESIFWMGHSPNAAAFGAAWDAWRDGQADGSSVPARLQGRFDACAEPNEARRSYDTY